MNEQQKPSRGQKTLCIPIESEEHYQRCVHTPKLFRQWLETTSHNHKEIFPKSFNQGFTCHGTYRSKKQEIELRRIKLKATGEVYQVRPSFLMPYLTARTGNVEKAMFLCRFGVPFDALTYVFGKNSMFWYRQWRAMGRPSIVGSTVKSRDKLPKHLVADEKHTKLNGEPVFVPTTAAQECILGASVVSSTSTDDLEKGYGDFAKEAKQLDPDYSPQTVCLDGWQPSWNAWGRLFTTITIILCFLHSVIKIRKCSLKDEQLRLQTLGKVWQVYKAKTKASFSQRMRRLRQWVKDHLPQGVLREEVLKVCDKRDSFKQAYDFIDPYRTSNGVDRLMDYQDRRLYSMRYFHGTTDSARMSARAMALMWNFHPYGSRVCSNDGTRRSPFHDLNGFEYHSNWLHNYLIASSMAGTRASI